MAVQFLQPRLAPGQVVVFLAGGPFHAISHRIQPRGQRLPLIERLGAHLAGMVDSHQAGRQQALGRL
jgi:hypothetical protein